MIWGALFTATACGLWLLGCGGLRPLATITGLFLILISAVVVLGIACKPHGGW